MATETFKLWVLAVLQACKDSGMDYMPVADNMPLDILMKHIEDEDDTGKFYLEIFRQSTLDELNNRKAFGVNTEVLSER